MYHIITHQLLVLGESGHGRDSIWDVTQFLALRDYRLKVNDKVSALRTPPQRTSAVPIGGPGVSDIP